MKPNSSHERWFFVLAALEAGAAFFALVSIPHEASGGVLLGFSLSRLSILAFLCALLVIEVYLAIRPPSGIAGFVGSAHAWTCALFSTILAIALFLLRYLDPERLLPFYQRLSPLLLYLLVLGVQAALFILYIRYGLHRDNLAQRQPVYFSALLVFSILLGTLLFVAITRVGLTPDSAYWGEPGVPVMGWQLALAIFGGLLCFLLTDAPSKTSRIASFLIPTLIWLVAVVIWLNVPVSVMQNSFYAPMGPPANQPFPNSDAGYYDSMAQSLLIGYPYQGNIPTRPLFIVFLAFLHLLLGEHYDLIIAGQTLVLALVPVTFYFLAAKLHSRAAGVIVALIAIFREWTSLLISSQTRVSNTKTLLVDLPTLLLVALACLFTLYWLERRDWKSGIAAGGLFGVLLLLRTQSMLILPFVFVVVVLAYWSSKRRLGLALAVFLTGLAVTVLPWLIHNYLNTGQLALDAPFQYRLIASQYQYTGNLDINNSELQGKSLFGILWTFATHDPKFVVGFIATHFFATQINGLLALPLIERYNGLMAPLNLYWLDWNGKLSGVNLTVLILYLGVIAIGLGAAWSRLRWVGLMPLAFSVGYALANGVGRFSGWRYDLPADWITYFYFAIGVVELFAAVGLLFGRMVNVEFIPGAAEPLPGLKWQQGLLLGGTLAIIGALPWFAEGLTPARYADQNLSTLVGRLASSAAVQRLAVNQAQIETFTSAPQATLQVGRVLYPRFFTRDTGLASAHPWPAYAVRDFPRMGFLLLNESRQDVLFPSREIPNPFPQASDAIVLGCQRTDYIEARLILLPGSDTAYLSTSLANLCN